MEQKLKKLLREIALAIMDEIEAGMLSFDDGQDIAAYVLDNSGFITSDEDMDRLAMEMEQDYGLVLRGYQSSTKVEEKKQKDTEEEMELQNVKNKLSAMIAN